MNKLVAGFVGLALLLPVGIIVVSSSGDDEPSCSSGSAALAMGVVPGGLGLSAAQVANGRAVVSTSLARAGQPAAVIAVMTALTESGLQTLDHGDAAGPDSRGLFQQRASWGPEAVRMDPVGSTGLFLNALLAVPGWQSMAPSLAAQRVQRSVFADGSNYAKQQAAAESIVAAMTQPSGAYGALSATETACGSGSGTAAGGAEFALSSGSAVADVATVRGRAVAIAAALQAGVPDPYYGATTYWSMCAQLAARLNGHYSVGFAGSAAAQWAVYQSRGLAHEGDTAPPPGALLFYATSRPAGHVATYLGNGQVVSNDVLDAQTGRVGGVYIVPATSLTNGPWRLTYLGWAPPIYT